MESNRCSNGPPGGSGASGGGRFAGLIAGLDGPGLVELAAEALRGLAGQVLVAHDVSDVELVSTVEGLRRVETMAHAELLRQVEEVAQRGAYASAGSRSTVEFLAWLGLTRGEARQVEDTARALAQLPKTAERLAAGELGAGQAQVVARKLAELAGDGEFATAAPERAAALDEVVAQGADQARAGGRRLDRRELRDRIHDAAETLAPGILEQRERRLWDRRGLRVWDDPDGALNIAGKFDAVGSAAVRTAINALARPSGSDDDRTGGQRAADAVVELARRALDQGQDLPQSGGQRPHLLVITTDQAQAGMPAADPSLLDGYGPVSSAVAAMIACDAEATHVTIGRDGGVLNVGRAHRDPSRAQRAAVIARDRRCVGCAAPVSRCEIHHIRWWSRGGATDLDNLTLVCWTCHHRIHHDSWQVVRDPHTGRFTVTAPAARDGTPPRRARPTDPAAITPAQHRRTA